MTKLTVNVHEAKTQLSRLIERALAGDEVVIARAGQPAVVLTPVTPEKAHAERPLGLLQGQIWIAPDFDDVDAEIEAAFEGGDDKALRP